MPTLIAIPITARELFTAVQHYGPSADGEELAFDLDLPPELLPVLSVLHTGLRAQLVGRNWYGERSDWPKLTVLSPSAPIPAGITLLCVEHDSCWDRIHPAARFDLPRLFAADASDPMQR